MTTQEFWNKYTSEDILNIYDDIKHFFSEKLPTDFINEYNYGEVILETRGHHETAKEFEKVIEFTKILQTKQPKIYEEYHQYFDDFLIDYYCFHNQVNMLKQPVENFFTNPAQGIDEFLSSFRKLLYYQQIELIDSIVINMYQKIENSPGILDGAGYELAIAKFYIELEKQYKYFLNNGNFEWGNFINNLKKYNFNFEPGFLPSLENGFIVNNLSIQGLKEYLEKDTNNFSTFIEGYFLKSMLNKGFSFPLSGKIWDEMLEFWTNGKENKEYDLENHFCIEYDAFLEFLNIKSGGPFFDNSADMAAIIWGAQYIYDFLQENGINKETYAKAFDILNIQKARLITKRLTNLWSYNFIHKWEKADSISQSEFEAEHNIFKKSYLFKTVGWGQNALKKYRGEINEEINQMIVLKPFILESDVYEKKYKKIIKEQSEIPDNIPYISPPKIGRNEPCPCGSGKKYKKCCGR